MYWEGKGLVGEGVEGRASPMHGDKARPVQFSSVQDGICAVGKAHTRSTQPLRSVPNVAFERVPMFV